jgi:hypothetical protein
MIRSLSIFSFKKIRKRKTRFRDNFSKLRYFIKLYYAVIEQHMLDTNARKQYSYICLINTGVEKINKI